MGRRARIDQHAKWSGGRVTQWIVRRILRLRDTSRYRATGKGPDTAPDVYV